MKVYPEISERELLEVAERLLSHEALVQKVSLYERLTHDEELRQLLRRHRYAYLRHCSEMASMIHTLQQRSGWQAYNRPDERPDERSLPSPWERVAAVEWGRNGSAANAPEGSPLR